LISYLQIHIDQTLKNLLYYIIITKVRQSFLQNSIQSLDFIYDDKIVISLPILYVKLSSKYHPLISVIKIYIYYLHLRVYNHQQLFLLFSVSYLPMQNIQHRTLISIFLYLQIFFLLIQGNLLICTKLIPEIGYRFYYFVFLYIRIKNY
jgi:hypothetical protein